MQKEVSKKEWKRKNDEMTVRQTGFLCARMWENFLCGWMFISMMLGPWLAA